MLASGNVKSLQGTIHKVIILKRKFRERPWRDLWESIRQEDSSWASSPGTKLDKFRKTGSRKVKVKTWLLIWFYLHVLCCLYVLQGTRLFSFVNHMHQHVPIYWINFCSWDIYYSFIIFIIITWDIYILIS